MASYVGYFMQFPRQTLDYINLEFYIQLFKNLVLKMVLFLSLIHLLLFFFLLLLWRIADLKKRREEIHQLASADETVISAIFSLPSPGLF